MKNINQTLITFSLCALLISPLAVAASNKPNKIDKSNNPSATKKVVPNEKLKGYEKPVEKVNTHAILHKEKVQNVAKTIRNMANTQPLALDTEVSEELGTLAEEQEESSVETAELIEEIEEQPAWKTTLLGTNFRNLGQLRSSLVKTRNQIRTLTKTMERVPSEEDKTLIQNQIEVLTQERERIKDIISTEESQFSLLGWVSRFLFGYVEEDLDAEEEEVEFIEEIEEVLGIRSQI